MPRPKKNAAAVPEKIAAEAEKSVEKEEASAETTKAPAAKKASSKKTAEKAPAEKAPAKRTRKAKEDTVSPYDKLVADVRAKAEKAKLSKDFAVEVTVRGAADGKFYVKSADGKADVQPYEYNDADLRVDADYDALSDIIAGKLSLSDAVENGSVDMYGGKASTMIAFRNVIA